MTTLNDYVNSFIFEEIDKDNLLELEKILKPSKIISIINEILEQKYNQRVDNVYADEMLVKLNEKNSGISVKSVYNIDCPKISLNQITLLFKIFSSDIDNFSKEKKNRFRVCVSGESKDKTKLYEEVDCTIPRETAHTDYFYEALVKTQIETALDYYSKAAKSK